jgi:SAM-dependent methyltransferase
MVSSRPHQGFRDFERAGWEDPSVVANYDKHIACITTQAVDALLDSVTCKPGERLLDVATGAGYLVDAAARRGIDAIGLDFSAAQVQLARSKFPSLRFEQADAMALPFQEGCFHAVVNGFGLCHLTDPDIALREAFRVLKPGGRVAFTVYDVPERAVALGAVYAAVRLHGTFDIGLPPGPDFFLLSDPARSKAALSKAGFVDTAVRRVPQTWRIAHPNDLLEAITVGSVRGGALLGAQRAEHMDAIRRALCAALVSYRSDVGFDVPAPALLASAVKPQKASGGVT